VQVRKKSGIDDLQQTIRFFAVKVSSNQPLVLMQWKIKGMLDALNAVREGVR
jgi:hypothetical protein